VPENKVYLFNHTLFDFFFPLIIGPIEIVCKVTDNLSEIKRVEFYLDDDLKYFYLKPTPDDLYRWYWRSIPIFGIFEITIKAYDTADNLATRSTKIVRFI
jgi:hypothetical protein